MIVVVVEEVLLTITDNFCCHTAASTILGCHLTPATVVMARTCKSLVPYDGECGCARIMTIVITLSLVVLHRTKRRILCDHVQSSCWSHRDC